MATKNKETPEQIASKKRDNLKFTATQLGQFACALEFGEWLQENHLLPGENVMELAESYAIRFSGEQTKAVFQALINS